MSDNKKSAGKNEIHKPEEFDFNDFGAMPGHEDHTAHEHEHTGPNMHEMEGASDFDDVESPEHEHEHEGSEHTGETEEEHEEAPEGKSMLSKLIVPVGMTVLGLVAIGGVWSTGMLDSIIGGGDTAPTQVATNTPPVVPRGPVAPANSVNPPVRPSLPAPMNSTGPQLPVTNPVTSPTPVTTPMQQQRLPVVQPAPEAVLPPSLETSLNKLVKSIDDSATHLADVTKSLDSTQKLMISRFDQTDGKISSVGEKVVAVEQRMGTIEQRVMALESKPATVAVAKPEVTTGMNTRIQPRHVTSPRPMPSVSSPVVADTTRRMKASDYLLVGVSSSHKTALLKTTNGTFLEVEIGKMIPGLGIAKEFTMKGQDWTLVTSNGTIEP